MKLTLEITFISIDLGKMVSNSNDGSNTRDLIYFSISHD